MPENERLLCSECGRPPKKHLSRGMCNSCYVTWLRQAKRSGTYVKAERTTPVQDRIRAKVQLAPNGCMHWAGYVNPNGYGRLAIDGQMVVAHRASYEAFVGPIPTNAQIDHTCHNRDAACPGGPTCEHRKCVNPDHLEAVTPGENQKRSRWTNAGKPNCANGHPLVSDNVYFTRAGHRACKQCNREKARRRRQAE